MNVGIVPLALSLPAAALRYPAPSLVREDSRRSLPRAANWTRLVGSSSWPYRFIVPQPRRAVTDSALNPRSRRRYLASILFYDDSFVVLFFSFSASLTSSPSRHDILFLTNKEKWIGQISNIENFCRNVQLCTLPA